MFLIDTFSDIFLVDLNFFKKKIIIFESIKNTIKQIKKAAKYPRL
jgi:hypothetical protein